MLKKNKIYIVIIYQMVVYLLVYLIIPIVVDKYGVHGDPFGGAEEAIELFLYNLIIITAISFVFMYFFANKIRYCFLYVPIYLLMQEIFNPSDDIYWTLIEIDILKLDFFIVMTLVTQLITCLIVKLIKIIKRKKFF